MMISSVREQFPPVTGKLTLDEADPTRSHVEASIETASIETHDTQRDAHLKSADFFDVEKLPTLSLKSTGIRLVRRRELAIEGDLTIRGITPKLISSVAGPTPPTKDPWGQHASCGVCNHKDQPQELRTAALEPGGFLCGRRGDHHSRCSVR
jgi:polyisoprenoid-binding protein YceI